MFFKVTWLTVMVLLILPEKDMAKAQNTDLTNAESRVSFEIKNYSSFMMGLYSTMK